MQKIVAIGGGDFKTYKTLEIDKEIVELSEKKNPKLLFIPTASSDNEIYSSAIKKHFGDLGCIVDVLYLIKKNPQLPINKASDVAEKILSADIIYVGGGNTLKMMRLWRKLGVDKLLDQARKQGTVLCGVSAGSICWFNYGNSDSRKFRNPQADYIKVTGLGFIQAFHCPHYDTESERKASLQKMMKKFSGIAVAIDDCAALEIVNDKYRIITSNENANAYKVYWKQNKFYEEQITKTKEYKNLEDLLKK